MIAWYRRQRVGVKDESNKARTEAKLTMRNTLDEDKPRINSKVAARRRSRLQYRRLGWRETTDRSATNEIDSLFESISHSCSLSRARFGKIAQATSTMGLVEKGLLDRGIGRSNVPDEVVMVIITDEKDRLPQAEIDHIMHKAE